MIVAFTRSNYLTISKTIKINTARPDLKYGYILFSEDIIQIPRSTADIYHERPQLPEQPDPFEDPL